MLTHCCTAFHNILKSNRYQQPHTLHSIRSSISRPLGATHSGGPRTIVADLLFIYKKVGFIEYIWPQSGNFLYLFWQTV